MAGDFGDESGEKLFDFMVRFGERMGEDAIYRVRSFSLYTR